MNKRQLKPLHPCHMILANLEAMELSVPKAAEILSMTKQHLYRVTKGASPVTPDLAQRLGTLFGNGALFWLKLQAQYDAWKVADDYARDKEKSRVIKHIESSAAF